MALGSVLDNPGVFPDLGERYALLGVVLKQLSDDVLDTCTAYIEMQVLTLVMTSRASGETLAGILRSTRAIRLYVATNEY